MLLFLVTVTFLCYKCFYVSIVFKKNSALCYNFVLIFLLFIIKIEKAIDVIDLVVGSIEFEGQGGGGGSQGFLGQNRVQLSLDRRRLRLQLSYSLSRFLEGKSYGVTDHN